MEITLKELIFYLYRDPEALIECTQQMDYHGDEPSVSHERRRRRDRRRRRRTRRSAFDPTNDPHIAQR